MSVNCLRRRSHQPLRHKNRQSILLLLLHEISARAYTIAVAATYAVISDSRVPFVDYVYIVVVYIVQLEERFLICSSNRRRGRSSKEEDKRRRG